VDANILGVVSTSPEFYKNINGKVLYISLINEINCSQDNKLNTVRNNALFLNEDWGEKEH